MVTSVSRAGLVLLCASTLVLMSAAVGSAGVTHPAATKSPITINAHVGEEMNASFTITGRFIMAQVGVVIDTGSAAIRPANGAIRIVDGQHQEPVNATANLKGKDGILSVHMRGLSIAINDLNPSRPNYGAEYGSWKITGGTGMYEGWTGGGRWASASSPTTTHIQWDGFVTK